MAKPEGYLISGKELVSYTIYFTGQNISFALPALFLVIFLTDLGIPAGIVGVVTLIVKIWDAVNDPIFGGIVDKVHLPGGKFMPWIKIAVWALPVATVLLFAMPSAIPLPAKIAWAIVAYMLWDTAYTISDLPIFALVTTMTDNVSERNRAMSWARIMGLVAFIVATLVIPPVRQVIPGWLAPAVVLSVLTAALMLPIARVGRERITPPPTDDNFGFREMFTYLGKNKYLLIINLAFIVSTLTNTTSALAAYIARYNLGDEAMLTLLTAGGVLPALVFGAILPSLARRFDKFKIFFTMFLASVVLGVALYFIGYQNQGLFLVAYLIRSIPSGAALVMCFMFTPDCVEYGYYRSGINASGVAFSVQTFSAKFSTAMGTAVSAFALAAIGFVETAGAEQAPDFPDKLWLTFTIIPSLGALLALPLLLAYKLRDKDVQIMAQANTGQISRQEADELLGGRYR